MPCREIELATRLCVQFTHVSRHTVSVHNPWFTFIVRQCARVDREPVRWIMIIVLYDDQVATNKFYTIDTSDSGFSNFQVSSVISSFSFSLENFLLLANVESFTLFATMYVEYIQDSNNIIYDIQIVFDYNSVAQIREDLNFGCSEVPSEIFFFY